MFRNQLEYWKDMLCMIIGIVKKIHYGLSTNGKKTWNYLVVFVKIDCMLKENR